MASALALNFDPPRAADAASPEPRPLKVSQLRAVSSGSPYVPQQRPGNSAEPESATHPWRMRGLYPDPGLAFRMRIRDPAIDSGHTAKYFRALARPWRVLDRPNLATEAKARSERVRRQLYTLRRGLAQKAAEYIDRGDQYGFGSAERCWIVTDQGEWQLTLVWLESWQFYAWVDDEHGFPLFAILRSARGFLPIPVDKLAHIGRRDTERCPEGHSSDRPLYWTSEDKRRILVRNAIARDNIGLGTRIYSVDDDELSADTMAMLQLIETTLTRNENRWTVKPKSVEQEWDHGPQQAPQYRDDLQYHDHSIAKQYGDTLSEQGQSVQGARAVGVEQRKTADLVEQGECKAMAAAITEELIWPIYDANGWPREEAPYCYVAGFADVGAWRAMAEILREDTNRRVQNLPAVLEDQDIVDMRTAFRLGFGLGADYV